MEASSFSKLSPTRRVMAISGVFSLLACAPMAAAEAQLTTLKTVVVTAQAPVESLTYTTDPKLPRQPVPASDGADYLKTIPGFNALRNGGTNGDPVLRGMFGSRLNLLTNDGSMPGACPSRMDNPLSYVAPETFDNLVVIKGPQTVLWGPGASAGTVRFERRVEHFDEPAVRVSASVLGGSFDRNDQVADVVAGAPVGYARISGNRSRSGDYDDGAGDKVPAAWKKWNADLALGWTPDENTLLEASLGGGDGWARYAGRGMDGAQFERTSYALRFHRKNLGGALEGIEASAFHNTADHVMDNYSLREPNPHSAMPMPMVSNVDRETWGGRIVADWRWGRILLNSGVDFQDSQHRQRGGIGRDTHQSQPWNKDADFTNTGVFTELSWALTENRRWIAGGRLDRAEVTDQRATMRAGHGHGGGQMANPTAGATRKESLHSGFIRYEQSAGALGWYAGLGHVERMPDYWELFSANMGPMGSDNAFAGIEPEYTTQLDVGLNYSHKDISAWLSAYAGRVDDFILFTYRQGMMGMTTVASNVDARIQGSEAGVEWRPLPHWTMGGTLAYAWGKNRDNGKALPQMPPLEARFSLSYDNGRWSVGMLVRAVSEQNRVAEEQGNIVGRDLGPSAGFATLAFNGGYRLGDNLQLTAGVDNLFDRRYSEHLNLAGSADFGYPADPVRINEPGRTAWLKLNYFH